MRRAGAEAPAAGPALGLDVQVDDAPRTGARRFEAMIGSVDADLLESERFDEERLLLARVANRQHRAKEAASSGVSRDLSCRPRIPVVAALLDHFEEQPDGMPHPQILRAESFLHAAVFGLVAIEVIVPERDRSVRNGVAGTGQLAGPGAPRLPRVRKTRGDRTDVGVGIAVIEVIDRDVAIHQNGLLDQPLPENLSEEVDILLRAAGAQRDVVHTLHEACHGILQTGPAKAGHYVFAYVTIFLRT